MERLADVQNPAIKLFITATMSQAQIQTSAQVTTPEKYMNTAAVSCNKRHNITYLHTVPYISNWMGYSGFFFLILISSNSTTSFLLGIFEKKDVT
jgi:hypothetical protein